MIIARLAGGLANQMSVYAAGRALAEKNNCELKIDLSAVESDPLRWYDLDKLGIKADIAQDEEIRERIFFNSDKLASHKKFHKRWLKLNKKLPYSWKRVYKEKSQAFDTRFFELRSPVLLLGNFPSLRYADPVYPLLQKEFAVTADISAASLAWLEKIQSCHSICLHIRRTDFVENAKTAAFHGNLDQNYYSSAVAHISQQHPQCEIFVFSDDIAWVKNNMQFELPTHFVDCNDAANGYQDLHLMQHCHHFIIANSGFSKWAAYLSNNRGKMVCMPSQWYSDQSHIPQQDLAPLEWIRL